MTRDPSPLARQLTALKQDIQTLRQALVPLRQAKEDCLRQREQFRLRLKDKILSIKALKSHQDTLSQAVSDHRKERDVYNRQVRQLIQQARALQREKQQFLKQHKVKGNPLRLKEQIAHLEESIETEAYTYDRERKVMEKIKQMKKVYEESAGLAGFKAKEGGRLFASTPISFEYSLNNDGGDRVVPKGELVIRNTLWLKSTTLLANEREGSVLPSSSRRFTVVWGEETKDAKESAGFFKKAKMEFKDFHLGWYTANLNLSWGESNQAFAKYHLFIFPWQLLLIALIILVIVWWVGRAGLRRYNRYIITQATKQK